MATMQGLVDRLRLELADARSPFSSSVIGDGTTRRYELPASPLEPTGFLAAITNGGVTTPLAPVSGYMLDGQNGVISLALVLPQGAVLSVSGYAGRFFSDADLQVFIQTAFDQHTHTTDKTLATLPPVEDYLVTLLACVEALYALLNDTAFDIDVNTPEGVSIPRSQRFRQLMELIEQRKAQYKELAQALNVGINRIEMFNLRRISRTTGRYVPLYIDREIEDASPPRRVFQAIDQQGAVSVLDPAKTLDFTLIQGMPFETDLTLGTDLTGAVVRAAIRRHDHAGPLVYFVVTVTDPATGAVHLSLPDTSRRRFYFNGDLAWSISVRSGINQRTVETLVKGKVFIVERPLL